MNNHKYRNPNIGREQVYAQTRTRIHFQSYLPKVAYHVVVTRNAEKAVYFLNKQIQVYGGYDRELLDKCKSVMRIYNLGLMTRKQCDLEMVDAGVPYNIGHDA